jgi:hypothetical protein
MLERSELGWRYCIGQAYSSPTADCLESSVTASHRWDTTQLMGCGNGIRDNIAICTWNLGSFAFTALLKLEESARNS